MAEYTEALNWEKYLEWLLNNKSHTHAKYCFKWSKKFHHYAFSDELIIMPQSRHKQDILKGIANLTRYLDIVNDTELHDEFLRWMKKKEIKWRVEIKRDNYQIGNRIKIDDILSNIVKLPEKYKIFALFTLVSGLRTTEAKEAFNNHEKLCNDGIMEMFWDRKTKKTNAVFCHPLLHTKLKGKVSSSRITKNLHSENLGCEIRYLRKLNYTLNATKIDPLLAEFFQGRRGNISQRHYFLPLMNNYRNKWINLWKKIILKIPLNE